MDLDTSFVGAERRRAFRNLDATTNQEACPVSRSIRAVVGARLNAKVADATIFNKVIFVTVAINLDNNIVKTRAFDKNAITVSIKNYANVVKNGVVMVQHLIPNPVVVDLHCFHCYLPVRYRMLPFNSPKRRLLNRFHAFELFLFGPCQSIGLGAQRCVRPCSFMQRRGTANGASENGAEGRNAVPSASGHPQLV
jgi:hypothetical protein